jgi:hypothetical protein
MTRRAVAIADRPRIAAAAALGLGLLAVAAATLAGRDASWLAGLVTPPAVVRAALVGLAVAIGTVLLVRAVIRLGGLDEVPGGVPRTGAATSEPDVRGMIRGVRLAFLALAAFAAAAGWLLAHPLPLIVAAVIAGIDVIETSFLLLVVGRGGPRP